jgi:hypothetical protein
LPIRAGHLDFDEDRENPEETVILPHAPARAPAGLSVPPRTT